MTKPLDINRLKTTLRRELKRLADKRRSSKRAKKLRSLAREVNIERKLVAEQLDSTCADLTNAYRNLSGQMALQQIVLGYQSDLLAARTDDDVFRALFNAFVKRSGPVFGAALVCDAEAQLRMIGRFGVPKPDKPNFCRTLLRPIVDMMITSPACTIIDAAEQREIFNKEVQQFLPGMTLLTMPLCPAEGEMIGLVVFYRKGEQPFTEMDASMAEILSHSTALAVQRND
jgi:hypothetical protein